MTEAEFAAYLADAVRGYADAHIRAGDVLPEEALRALRRITMNSCRTACAPKTISCSP